MDKIPKTWDDWKVIVANRPHIADSLLAFVVFQVVYAVRKPSIQWQYMIIYGLAMILITAVARTPFEFFKGGIKDTSTDRSSYLLLAFSTFISWIFAKSIQNTSILGAEFGVIGGFGYASWYFSFFSVGTVAYFLRSKHGYTSLQEAIYERYGAFATISYSLAVLFRLYQEIWSNSLVVASFYGDYNTASWWIAAILSTFIPFVYVSIGGMRSTLISDVLQAFLAIILFISLLSVIKSRVNGFTEACHAQGREHCKLVNWDTNVGVPTNTLAGGWDLVLVGLVQGIFSYPYFDPILTDRAFLASPKTMMAAFYTGGLISMIFIFFFGFVGVFGNMAATLDPTMDPAIVDNVKSGIPADIAQYLGTAIFTVTNIIFMTTSISTIDSTLACTSKLSAEMKIFFRTWYPEKLANVTQEHVKLGRFAIRFIALVGNLQLLQDPSSLDATTVSGTVVMGLGPPIFALLVLPRADDCYYPLSFFTSFWFGVIFGFLYQYSSTNPEKINLTGLTIGSGAYGNLLWFNMVGLASSFGLFLLFFVTEKYALKKVIPFYRWHQTVLEQMTTERKALEGTSDLEEEEDEDVDKVAKEGAEEGPQDPEELDEVHPVCIVDEEEGQGEE